MPVGEGEFAGDLGIEGVSGASVVGQGGFGVVYRARQEAFGRTVAVKLLSAPALAGETGRRFEQECRALGALSGHPHIVALYGSGTTASGQPYLLMDFLPGGTLAQRLGREGPRPWTEVADLGVKLAGALATAHAAGVLHRDLKPENALISAYGEPQLVDFGVARIQGGTATRSGVITGSLAHAAPEVLSGKPATEASDVYSLASTLYALLAGQAPFVRPGDETFHPLITRIISEEPPDLTSEGVPQPLWDTLAAALAKDPAARTASALALGEGLRSAQRAGGVEPTALVVRSIDDLPEAAIAPAVPENATFVRPRGAAPAPAVLTAPPSRRPPWIAAAAVAAAVVLLAAGLLALTQRKKPASQQASAGSSTSSSATSSSSTTLPPTTVALPVTTIPPPVTTAAPAPIPRRPAPTAAPAPAAPTTRATPPPAPPPPPPPASAAAPTPPPTPAPTARPAPPPTSPPAPAATSDNSPCSRPQQFMFNHWMQQCPVTQAKVPVYANPDDGNNQQPIGYLYTGGSANWFVGQIYRSNYTLGGFANRWWAYTLSDKDSNGPSRWGWVPQVYFKGGDNDERDSGLYQCANYSSSPPAEKGPQPNNCS